MAATSSSRQERAGPARAEMPHRVHGRAVDRDEVDPHGLGRPFGIACGQGLDDGGVFRGAARDDARRLRRDAAVLQAEAVEALRRGFQEGVAGEAP